MTPPEDDQPGAGDIVQAGRPPRLRSGRLGSVLLACLVAAAVLVVVTHSNGPSRAQARPSPPLPSPLPAVSVIRAGHPILGIRAGWALFGLGSNGVVAVHFASGRIVRSGLPPIQDTGPISFVVAKGEVIVRPLDGVPGYVVPDGKAARPLTGFLAQGGILLPGPSLSQQWFDQFGPTSVRLIGPNGKPTGVSLATPRAAQPFLAMSDGRGDVVLVDESGVMYDVGPGRFQPVGALLIAVGPTNWLTMRCAGSACHDLVVDPATGATRAVPGPPITATPWTSSPGVIAPDGTTAAVVVPGTSGRAGTLELINLGTGATTRVEVPVDDPSYQQLAWSPDGRWLFAVTARGTLAAINTSAGRAEILPLGVSGLNQIAIRQTSG